MGKFSRKREYSFASLEEMIFEIVEHFNEGINIDILAMPEDTETFITALCSTELFIPYCLDYSNPEVNNYCDEYQISLNQDTKAMFIEPALDTRTNLYFESPSECIDLIFISKKVSKRLYQQYIDNNCNVVFFDILK